MKCVLNELEDHLLFLVIEQVWVLRLEDHPLDSCSVATMNRDIREVDPTDRPWIRDRWIRRVSCAEPVVFGLDIVIGNLLTSTIIHLV
jgi:hypothetical protein